ncbi:hypothetical protein HY772_06890 [Candidatus Woesearchaeota archaeon]|nr:hypothetical protein [Candidatus Woesearchaeota archaeon]
MKKLRTMKKKTLRKKTAATKGRAKHVGHYPRLKKRLTETGCIVKRHGHVEVWDERKCYGAVYAAFASAHYAEEQCEKEAQKICNVIRKHMKGASCISSHHIREMVSKMLRERDEDVAFLYDTHLDIS